MAENSECFSCIPVAVGTMLKQTLGENSKSCVGGLAWLGFIL